MKRGRNPRWRVFLGIALIAGAAMTLTRVIDGPGGDEAMVPPSSTAPEPGRTGEPSGARGELNVDSAPGEHPGEASHAEIPTGPVPLAEIEAELRRRSRAGDGAATCRLASELANCGIRPLRAHEARMAERRAILTARGSPDRDPDRDIDQAARYREALVALDIICEGIPADRSTEAMRLRLLAADQGHVPSMERFVLAFDIPFGGAFLTYPEHAELYRRNAPRVALTALHAGSREAVYQLYLANLPHMGSPLAQISEPVAADALAYGLLARLVGLPVSEQQLAWLVEDNDFGPGEIAAATSRAEDLFDRYFQSVHSPPTDPGRDRPAPRFWGDRGGAEC